MEIKIRPSRPEDAGELATIDSLCSQGKTIVFHYNRHNYFGKSKQYKKWAVFVAEAGNVIVGMVAACVKTLKISQKFLPVGYIYDLKVHPRWRRQGISYRLLESIETYLRAEKVTYVYSYLFGENPIVKKITNSLDMYYCGDFKVLFFQCISTTGPAAVEVRNTDVKKIIPAIETYYKDYDLREKKTISVQYKKPIPGSPYQGIFSLPTTRHTTAALWDDAIHSARILDRRPVSLRLLDKMSDRVKKKFHIPYFPGVGEHINICHLFDIQQETDDPDILLDFITSMQTFLYTRGVHLFTIHLDIRDPLYKILKNSAFTIRNGKILMRTSIAGELPPLLHHLYIDVRDL